MSPPNKISVNPTIYYDEGAGLCLSPESLASFPKEGSAPKPLTKGSLHLSGARLAQLAAGGSQAAVPMLWRNPASLTPGTLLLGITGCAADASGSGGMGDVGMEGPMEIRSIADLSPVDREAALNPDPITGEIRQVALGMNRTGEGVVAWSVKDFVDPSGHGVFSAPAGERIAAAAGSIPRDTSVAVLPGGDSILFWSQIQGDSAPSSLLAQRLDAGGRPQGAPMIVLPEAIRTGFPRGQVLPMGEGFVAVFADGEGNTTAAVYDAEGQEQERQTIGPEAGTFQIASAGGEEWALATLEGGLIRVRKFSGAAPTGVEMTLDPNPIAETVDGPPLAPDIVGNVNIAASSDLSLAMQPDGSMMVAWNALSDQGESLLEGAFLNPDASPVGNNILLRNLVQGSGFDSQGHINSHSLTADGKGNFILGYEENRSLFGQIYHGPERQPIPLEDIASQRMDNTGAYADLLGGLDNPSVQNVDVQVAVSREGLLALAYTKILSAVDPATGETVTVNKVMRRDYQISYE